MKATGIIRRIDELGRVVIPKEIRKLLHITDGTNLEIFIDDAENIILSKFSEIKQIKDISQKLIDSIKLIIDKDIYITDNSNIIAATDKKIIGSNINSNIEIYMKERKAKITENEAISFINLGGDLLGSVVINGVGITNLELDYTSFIASFIVKYLED